MEARTAAFGGMAVIAVTIGACLWLGETEAFPDDEGPWTTSFLVLTAMAFNLGVTALYAGVRAMSVHRH
jgi:hypothetical protein